MASDKVVPLQDHEIAGIFPLMSPEEFAGIKADIEAHGLREPIRLYQGKIIDGRNRYRACAILKVKPTIEEWTGDDPVAYVLSLNLHRRHLTESQRAMVAAKLATMKRGGQPLNVSIDTFSRSAAASLLKVGTANVSRAKVVQAQGLPQLSQAVEDGSVSVSAAAEVAHLSPTEQAAVVAEGPQAIRDRAASIRRDRTPPPDDDDDLEPFQPATNGHASQTRVNGVLTDDPPDIARLRANGKLHPDIVPDVTIADQDEPEPVVSREPGEDEPRTDEEWLDELPIRAKLNGACRRWFDMDALLYRSLEESRKTFHHHARIALNVVNRQHGKCAYAYHLSRFLRIEHPKHWHLCVKPEDGGCGGEGTIGVIGQCPKCFGRGYELR